MFGHIFIMAGPLHGWANGNLLLLSGTIVTMAQYTNSVALMWNPDWYWDTSVKLRMFVFFLALMEVIWWVSSFIGELIKSRRARTLVDTHQEIIAVYILAMNIP